MNFDELEWVRDVIDRWLSEHAMDLAVAVAAALAFASLLR